MEHDRTIPQQGTDDTWASPARRGFLLLAAATGAAVSVGRSAAAFTDVPFAAADLDDDRLIGMYRTILQIRWHERRQRAFGPGNRMAACGPAPRMCRAS